MCLFSHVNSLFAVQCSVCTETKSRKFKLCTETADKQRFDITILKNRLNKTAQNEKEGNFREYILYILFTK